MTKPNIKPGQLWKVSSSRYGSLIIMVIGQGDGKGIYIPICSWWCFDFAHGRKIWLLEHDSWLYSGITDGSLLVDV